MYLVQYTTMVRRLLRPWYDGSLPNSAGLQHSKLRVNPKLNACSAPFMTRMCEARLEQSLQVLTTRIGYNLFTAKRYTALTTDRLPAP